ncbi:MAG: hypothetical protein GXO10_06575 [Crenarchaeota archaeon]|nr:hypothetical protein [Thermoproteota archaeon]
MQPTKYFDCKLTIDNKDYSTYINEIYINNNWLNPYPNITLVGDIDYMDIIQDKIFGKADIRLDFITYGPRNNILDSVSCDLVYLHDTSIIPSRPNNPQLNKVKMFPKYYQITVFPKRALSAASSYVNLVKHHTSLDDVLVDICSQVNLDCKNLTNVGSSQILDQVHIPCQSFISAIEELISIYGLSENAIGWFITMDGTFIIADINKLSKTWSKKINIFLSSETSSYHELKTHGLDTAEHDHSYIIRTDISVVNALQTNNTLLRYKQKIGYLPDDKLYDTEETTLTSLANNAISPTSPEFADTESNIVRWNVGNDIVSVKSVLASELLRSYIMSVALTDVTNFKSLLFDPSTYTFLVDLQTSNADYVPVTGLYFIERSDLTWVKKQQHHWEVMASILITRTSPTKV